MFKRRFALGSAAVLALTIAIGAGSASAETLQDAIALAYQTNPTLLAQRAQQRALDESYVQARVGLRPSLDISASTNYDRVFADTSPPAGDSSSGSVGISLSQTLYSGGRIAHGINAAEAGVLQGRENLRNVEQQVLANVIQAYVDVQRDMEILRIRQENLQVLRRQLDEASARFEVGEITRTDVAQAEARLAQSDADLAAAQAQLSVSRAAYAAVVGQAPTDLAPPPPLPGVPNDFDAALDVGLVENPALRAAEYSLVAAEARVARARAEYLPTARLSASYGASDDLSNFDLTDRQSLSATASISVPLFTGGLNRSQVVQALEEANAAQINVEGARREVLREVSQAYAQVISAASSLAASEEQVRAARIAAEGVRQEAQVGLRTTLDVLNQELELRNAEVAAVSARRNQYVAQAQLLAAMGRLQGEDLVASVEVYDPADNFNAVRGRGAVPWEGLIETIDRIAAPPIQPANDQVDAPIDQQLKSEIVRTAPGE